MVTGGGAFSSCVPSYVLNDSIASDLFDTDIVYPIAYPEIIAYHNWSSFIWDALIWDAVLPVGTSISFEVRASDILFLIDDLAPVWASVGTVSPVLTGLPSGR